MNIRAGVVCEGPTDFCAIEAYFGEMLATSGYSVEFISLQPENDRTQPDAGWGGVERWFRLNPYETRVRRYWGAVYLKRSWMQKSAIFFIIHMDADHINSQSFRAFIKKQYNYEFNINGGHREKLEVINSIFDIWFGVTGATSDLDRHAKAASVECTEAWCAAAYRDHRSDIEMLGVEEVGQLFMRCLLQQEGRPEHLVINCDKSVPRRKRYCQSTKRNVN